MCHKPRFHDSLLLLVFSVFVLFSSPAAAATWNVPGDASTIQVGIGLAGPADTVLVGPGTWAGFGNVNLTFGGKDIVLLSSAGRDQTTIDCGASARALIFNSGETAAAVVDGFTIRNGSAPTGGGIFVENANPVIRNCRLVDCYASSHGGAVDVRAASAPQFVSCAFDSNRTIGDYRTGGAVQLLDDGSFVDCTFRDNQAGGIGGAIRITNAGDISFESCIFERNTGTDGGAVANQGAVTVTYTDCAFRENVVTSSGGAIMITGALNTFADCEFDLNSGRYGGAIYVLLGDAVLEYCTVARSTSDTTSAALTVTNSGSDIDITNSIVYGTIGGAAVNCLNYGDVTPVCSNFYGNERGDWDTFCGAGENTQNGNMSEDPQFCDPDNGDFTLNETSPCLDAPGCGRIGAYGQGCSAGGIADGDGIAPGPGLLGLATPNPFGSTTRLSYTVPGGTGTHVRLTIHDVRGRVVRELVDRVEPAGEYRASWNGADRFGQPVAAGVYFYRLELDGRAETRHVILVR